jgi:hypothetical protein
MLFPEPDSGGRNLALPLTQLRTGYSGIGANIRAHVL